MNHWGRAARAALPRRLDGIDVFCERFAPGATAPPMGWASPPSSYVRASIDDGDFEPEQVRDLADSAELVPDA
jgi:hypothetical protein